jgi:hypothetical protein
VKCRYNHLTTGQKRSKEMLNYILFIATYKEVYQISSPRAMGYDKNNNKILLCNTGKKVFWFEKNKILYQYLVINLRCTINK